MKRLFLALLAGLILNSAAYSEEKQKCIRGQYLVSASVPALRDKAEEALEDAGNKEFSAIDENESAGITLLQTEDELRNGINDTSDPVLVRKSNNICEKMRSNRRLELKQMARTNTVSISALRRYDCTCNEIYMPSEVTPNDTYLSQLWGMKSGESFGIRATEAWGKSVGSNNVVVAVIDTGVDYTHPDLAENMWVNSGEIPGNGIDDDGNGYVDDHRGWNAITNSGNPMDDHGHGTHCAGTIGGRGNNAAGVAGVNWRVTMMPVKFLGANGGSTYDAIEAIDYVTTQKNRGVNLVLSSNSWGGGWYNQILYDAITRAKAAGLLFVAAAGNGGSDGIGDNNDNMPHYPSSYNIDNVISVAAIGSNGSLTSFSNFGFNSVDIAAPGSGIISTDMNHSYASRSGTSMATPHVAGALALLAAYNPSLTRDGLRDILYQTGRPLVSLVNKISTGALMDVNAMLAAAYSYNPPPTPIPTNTPTPKPTGLPTAIPSPVPTSTPTPTPVPGWYTLSGQVIDGVTNAPIVGAKIEVKNGNTSLVTYSDAQGNYSIPNILGPITYTMNPTILGHWSESQSIYMSGHKTLNITAWANAFQLCGIVIDTEKTPVAGVDITLNGRSDLVQSSDSTGNFCFTVPINFDYKLTASSGTYVFNNSVLSGTTYGNVKRVFVAKEN